MRYLIALMYRKRVLQFSLDFAMVLVPSMCAVLYDCPWNLALSPLQRCLYALHCVMKCLTVSSYLLQAWQAGKETFWIQ